jgi:NAD(P)-dependent dehydrogenase (short-subunit alcohol dehydrogenase family)
MNVKDKVIVVTGGGSGIGRELVLALLARGARVAAVDINETTLHETHALAGANADKVRLHIVNITDRQADMDVRGWLSRLPAFSGYQPPYHAQGLHLYRGSHVGLSAQSLTG